MFFSWERSLRHFEQRIIEAGNPLQLEHVQRLCKLFCRDGLTEDLRRWSRICQVEGIFPCSIQVETLIKRGLWETALLRLRPGMQFWSTTLAEEAVSRFIAQRQWTFALLALSRFPRARQTDSQRETLQLWTVESIPGRFVRTVDRGVSRSSSHVLSFDRTCLGPAQSVAALFNGGSSWEKALSVCAVLSSRTSKHSGEVLLELALSMAAESSQWEAVLSLVASKGERATLRMLRSSLRAAVSARNLSTSISILDTLSGKFGTRSIPVTQLNQLVAMVSEKSNFESNGSKTTFRILAKCWKRLSIDKYEQVASWKKG